MDGISFPRILMSLLIRCRSSSSSSFTRLARPRREALEAGAIEVLGKPTNPAEAMEFESQLLQKVRSAAAARLRPLRQTRNR